MPPGEPHTTLSPIERGVLAACDQWRTLEELQVELWQAFHFDRIHPAIAFLRRRGLLEVWEPEERRTTRLREELFKQTGLGELVLAAQLRKEESADFRPERRRRLSLV